MRAYDNHLRRNDVTAEFRSTSVKPRVAVSVSVKRSHAILAEVGLKNRIERRAEVECPGVHADVNRQRTAFQAEIIVNGVRRIIRTVSVGEKVVGILATRQPDHPDTFTTQRCEVS